MQIERKVKRPAVSGSRTQNTSGLNHQYSATEPQQPDDHQPSQPSIYTAQVVLNASVAHLAATHRPGGSKIALVWLTGTCTRVRTFGCTQKLGGSGGMFPQDIFFKFNVVRWPLCVCLRLLIFGAQNITIILCFTPGMVTGFRFTSRL